MMLSVFKKKSCSYDVTIFQTPRFGEKKGYRASIELNSTGAIIKTC